MGDHAQLGIEPWLEMQERISHLITSNWGKVIVFQGPTSYTRALLEYPFNLIMLFSKLKYLILSRKKKVRRTREMKAAAARFLLEAETARED